MLRGVSGEKVAVVKGNNTVNGSKAPQNATL